MAYGSPRGNKKRSALGGLFADPAPAAKKKRAQNGWARGLIRPNPAQRAKEERIKMEVIKRMRKKLGAQFSETAAQRAIDQALRNQAR